MVHMTYSAGEPAIVYNLKFCEWRRNMTIQYFKSRKAVVPTSSELQHDTVRVLQLGKL